MVQWVLQGSTYGFEGGTFPAVHVPTNLTTAAWVRVKTSGFRVPLNAGDVWVSLYAGYNVPAVGLAAYTDVVVMEVAPEPMRLVVLSPSYVHATCDSLIFGCHVVFLLRGRMKVHSCGYAVA
jgi:hypothetical protein